MVDGVGPPWDAAFGWVEDLTGGRVVRAERQARWRPAWFLDVERPDGATQSLYWRGDRGLPGSGEALRAEGRVLELLEARGLPVPHLFGRCDDPLGLLLERVPGREDFHRAPAEDQEQVAAEFLAVVARTHRLDPAEAAAAGLALPGPGTGQALASLARWARAVEAVPAPAPLVRLALWWLADTAPARDEPPVLVHGDCGPGQFLFEGGSVTAVLDWEFAHLGDPMEDLALMRSRDLSYPFGDFPRRLRQYVAAGGYRLDLPRLRWYSVLAMLITPAGLLPVLADPPPGTDLAQVLAWDAVYSRALAECLAEATGVPLGPVALPDGPAGPRAALHDAVVDGLHAEVDRASGYRRYRLEQLARLADHLRLADRVGGQADRDDLDDAGEVLGWRPADPAAALAGLEALVRSDPAGRFEALVGVLYRRARRRELLLGPLLGELAETATLSPLE